MCPKHRASIRWSTDRRCRAATAALVAVVCTTAATSRAAAPTSLGQLPDDVVAGWQVFVRKQCIQCHALAGLGGKIGPDLGRSEHPALTASQLAGALWNHIPRMHSYMLRARVDYPHLSLDEMTDLFAILHFVRQLDEPGDPTTGQRVLREKGCVRCHATDAAPEHAAPDIKRWGGYVNPVVWAQKMWEHTPKMAKAMQEAGVTWPQLDDTDLLHIMAYVRSVGGLGGKDYLRPGSVRSGARLFAERKCQSCHRPGGAGTDLATAPLPRGLAALASRMWNHSPEMNRLMQQQGIERRSVAPQEMADIIAYILSLRSTDRGGDAQRGRTVFEAKQCAQCHGPEPAENGAAPSLATLGAAATPVRLAHAMWNHGVTMMDRMSETGFAWPVFQADEMRDLVTYLRSIAPTETIDPMPVASPVPTLATPMPLSFVAPLVELGASCVTNECHPGMVAGRVVHEPTAQAECNACHTLLDPQAHAFTLVASTSELCYRCHEPREAMRTHGPVTIGVCTACHDPHSAENAYGPDVSETAACFADMIGMTFALETLVDGTSRSATVPVVSVPNVSPPLFSPAVLDPVRPGPLPQSVARPTSIESTCVTNECHASVITGPVVHGPTAQQQCAPCHTLVDEKEHRFALSAKEPDLCYECHDRPTEPAAFTHGPVGLGKCTLCHDPHGSPNKFMLPEPGPELCFLCHSEMASHVRSAQVQHKVIPDKGCVACHDPHRADVKFLLKREQSELCLECHEPIGEAINAAVVAHEPVSAGKKCVNCHNPHGSNVPKILANREMDLCLGCHDRPLDTPNGPIIDMKSWIADNPEHHGPIRDGNCTGCHEPHGASNFRILKHAFPRQFYRPFALETYALCFECHEETLVLDERTTSLTGFRNGDKNLHHLHVNQEKGRTCRACHEIHAGTKPKRIKDFVPFGQWKYPVNFEMTENGGRCAPGCHLPRTYDRRREIVQE